MNGRGPSHLSVVLLEFSKVALFNRHGCPYHFFSSLFSFSGRPSTYTSSASAIVTRLGPLAFIVAAKNLKVRSAIPHSDLIARLPAFPLLGELSYADVAGIWGRQRKWLSRPDRNLVDQLKEYLEMKLATRPRQTLTEHARL